MRSPRAGILGGLLLAGLACVGCVACGDPPRLRLIAGILEDRAGRLDEKTRMRVARALVRAESNHGINAILLIAVIEQESRFRSRVVSSKNAYGLMQLRPETAEDVAARHGMTYEGDEDLHDPAKNVAIGSTYLAELKEEFGTWELALAAYLNGPTKVRTALGQGRQVRSRYASRVLRKKRMIEELYVTEEGS